MKLGTIKNFKLFMSTPYYFVAVVIMVCSVVFISCGDNNDTIAPKPHSYFRLSFPEKKYTLYAADCPFRFDVPTYAKMEQDKSSIAEPCWLNLQFQTFHATLHLTYKEVHDNIQGYLEQTYTLESKHQVKASGIEEKLISRHASKVYGLLYEIRGNAASNIQFFLTDSTKHFIRGALYFYAVPNTDSISPVLDFIRKDIYHMIETFEWKNEPST